MKSKTPYPNREAWLAAALPQLLDMVAAVASGVGASMPGLDRPEPYVSVGWPRRRKRDTGAQCWCAPDSERAHIFVSPDTDCGEHVLAMLLHECIHALAGTECGHRGAFRQIHRALGFEAPATGSTPGAELLDELIGIRAKLGPYPHTALSDEAKPTERQKTRYRKWTCPACGQIVRAATDELHAYCAGGKGADHDIEPFVLEEAGK